MERASGEGSSASGDGVGEKLKLTGSKADRVGLIRRFEGLEELNSSPVHIVISLDTPTIFEFIVLISVTWHTGDESGEG